MIIHYLATANIPSKSANSLQIVKMCDAFASLGHNVKLISPNLTNLNHSAKEYYDLKNNFKIIKVGKKIQYISGLKNFFSPLFLVLKSLKEDKEAIRVTRNLIVSFFLIILRKKHIFEIHDDINIFGNKISFLYSKFNLLESKYILKIIFITNSLKNFIIDKYKIKKKNFLVLPDATEIVNFEKFKDKKKYNIGYVGSIYKSRGVQTVIDLANRDKNNKYFIYGGSSKEVEKLKYKINNLNTKIFKQVSYKKIKKIIPKMDILLLPYTKKVTVSGDVGNIYNFMSPMKMFDYLGSGKIILSSDVPVLREILKNKKNAILIKNFLNLESWLMEIEKIKYNYSRNIILSKNALKTGKTFNWKNRATSLINLDL